MKQQYTLFLGTLALAFLAGCGGGGGDGGTTNPGTDGTGGTAVAAMDKYVGTWSGCSASGSGTGSHLETVAISRSTDTSGTFTDSRVDYAASGCTGAATGTSTSNGTVVLTGTKTIGTDTVDEAILTEGTNPAEKQVLLVKGTTTVTLTTGRTALDGGPVDANGYPTTLDNSVLVKQSSGPGGTSATFDRYVGTWAACLPADAGSGSHRETVVITKTGDTSGAYSSTSTDYAAAGCTGTVVASSAHTGTVVFTGTKTIGTDTVDEGLITQETNPPEKQVFLVKGTAPATLTTGRSAKDGGPVDANGYPTTLESGSLIKQ